MDDSTMLELLRMIRNIKPQLENVRNNVNDSAEEHHGHQPALYQLNFIKDSVENVPTDTGSFSGLSPCSEQSGLPLCREQLGLPPCRELGLPPSIAQSVLPPSRVQSGLPLSREQLGLTPSRVQPGLLPTRVQSGLPPSREQLGLTPSCVQSGLPPSSELSDLPQHSEQPALPPFSEQSGLPPCSAQSVVKSDKSCGSSAYLLGHSFGLDKTYHNQTGGTSIAPGVSGEGQTVEAFEGEPLTERTNTFLISQIAHVAHRAKPNGNQEFEYAVNRHKVLDILNNPFMCGICGNIFSATSLLRFHVIRDHCLSLAPEQGQSNGEEGDQTVNKGDHKSEKSDFERNLVGDTLDGTLVNEIGKNVIRQQVIDGQHSITDGNLVQEKGQFANLKDILSYQKVDRVSRKNEDTKGKQLGGGTNGGTDTEGNCWTENPQRENGNSGETVDESDSDRIEETLKDLNLVSHNSDPTQGTKKMKETKIFKCEFCEEVFTSNRYRFKHRVASHPDCSFTCPDCDKTYKVHEKDKWQHHVRNHKPHKKLKQDSYSCQVCSMIFRAASSVAIHMQTFHPEYVKVEKPFCCEVCGNLFRTKRTMKLHQNLVHSDKKPYKCETCGRGFKLESYLRLHQRTHTGEKPFACKFCDKAFPSTAGRRSHERTHTNERPYKCSHCGRGFKSKPQLVDHERTHTKEKPFICPVCGKAFSSRTSFATHKFLHTGKKPFQCSRCSRAFAQKCNLEHHVRSIHTLEKPHQCSICGARFARSTGRSMHMQKKHGIKLNLRQGRPPLYPDTQEIDQIVQAGVSIDVSSGIMGHAILEDTLSLVVESLNG